MSDDAELLHRYASRRDETAFAELVRRHLDVVYFAAVRRCRGDSHRAEEVTQRVFTTLARDAGKLHRHAVLAGWLYLTTRNVAAKLRRDEKSRQVQEAEAWAMIEQRANEVPVDWDRLRAVLDDVMDELEDGDRDAILLRFFQGRPFAEIGATLHLKEDAVRMRVSRALDKLRSLLNERGVVSTAAALGVALAAQGAMAKPAGLAASVTTAALSGAAASAAGGVVATALGFMSTGKFSTANTLALFALLASLGTNAYLLTWPEAAPPPSATLATNRASRSEAAVTPPLDPAALVRGGDLVPLRDRLRVEGASDPAVRSVMEGILRRRYRAKLSQDRAERAARGWWKDAQRTWGTAESFQRLSDDPTLLRAMVTEPLERLLGPDPAEIAEAEAKYAFLPAELRPRLGGIDRAFPSGWGPTGDPVTDERLRSDYENTRGTLEAERTALLAELNPEQRQGYDMRFSRAGTSLARHLEPIGATEQEFVVIYPFADRYGKEYDALFRQENSIQKSSELDRRMVQHFIAALGYDRALDFVWAGASEYPSYARIAQETGLATGTAGRVVQLAAETSHRAAAIHAEQTLNLAEKTAALARLQQAARSELDQLVPPSAQQRLTPASLEWIESLGQGRYKPIEAVLPGRGNLKVVTGILSLSSTPPSRLPPPLVPPRANGG